MMVKLFVFCLFVCFINRIRSRRISANNFSFRYVLCFRYCMCFGMIIFKFLLFVRLCSGFLMYVDGMNVMMLVLIFVYVSCSSVATTFCDSGCLFFDLNVVCSVVL